MKKILSLTIALCLIFASVVPSYAEAWTTGDVSYVRQGITGIVTQITSLVTDFNMWWKTTATGSSLQYNFPDLVQSILTLQGWLVPDGTRGASMPTLYDSIIVLTNYAMNHLPDISVISGYVSSWMNTNNSYLNSLREGLTNNWSAYSYNTVQDRWSKMAHYLLYPTNSTGALYGWYQMTMFGTDGSSYEQSIPWNGGTPIGNVALLVKWSNENNIRMHQDFMIKALTDYTGQLGIWDSQGDTLTQEGWSPTSAINGLYKYLAYTQRDLARLTYVLASDEEIETREKARETQTAVMDDFIDPEGGAAASTENFGEIASGSANVKQNFSTGYSVSNMWGAFGSEHYGWFSQECADALDTSAASTSVNRLLKNDKHNESDYDTPLLDEYYRQIFNLGGGNDD